MLCSICCWRLSILAGVTVRSRLFTALKLAAVDGHDGLGKQLESTAHADEALADISDASAVVVTEVGDDLEVWRQPSGEPHQFDVALGLLFEPSAGLDAVQVPVDVELEKHRGVIRRSGGGGWICSFEAECLKIQFIDKDVDDALACSLCLSGAACALRHFP